MRTPQSRRHRRRCRAGPHYRRAVGNPRALTPNPQCRPHPRRGRAAPRMCPVRHRDPTQLRRGVSTHNPASRRLWSQPRSDPRRPRKILTRARRTVRRMLRPQRFSTAAISRPRRCAKAPPAAAVSVTPVRASRRCRPPPLSGVASLHGIRPHRFRSNPARSVPRRPPKAGPVSVLRLLPVTRASGATPPRRPRGRPTTPTSTRFGLLNSYRPARFPRARAGGKCCTRAPSDC